jgi:hypothetical protein
VLTLLCDSMYRWFVPLSHGLEALGIFVASMSLIRVLNPLILGLANLSTPLFAGTYAREGGDGLRRLAQRATALLAACLMVCLPMFVLWGGRLVELVFGHKYHGTGPVVTALAMGMLIHTLVLPVDSALLALRQGRFLLVVVGLRLFVPAPDTACSYRALPCSLRNGHILRCSSAAMGASPPQSPLNEFHVNHERDRFLNENVLRRRVGAQRQAQPV